jgi:hypothetical protein
MEEYILRTCFAGQFVDVVNQQQVDTFVKVDEIIDRVAEVGLRILYLE